MDYITPIKVFVISLLILFSAKVFAQTLDSLVLIEVSNLKEKEPTAAEELLRISLETATAELSNYQKAALYSRYQSTYLSLTKSEEARNNYFLKIPVNQW